MPSRLHDPTTALAVDALRETEKVGLILAENRLLERTGRNAFSAIALATQLSQRKKHMEHGALGIFVTSVPSAKKDEEIRFVSNID